MINFTQEHMAKLTELASQMLFSGAVVNSKLGQPLNVFDVLHTTTINTLNNIKNELGRKITKLEEADEWVGINTFELESTKQKKEFINLVIGYKRYQEELKETAAKKEKLQKELDQLVASNKTPDERIAELRAQIAEL